jgi:opacity protein-like surface antigen
MRKILISLVCLIFSFQLSAQDSLLRSLNNSMSASQTTEYVTGTFKALYIVNMKTIEAPAAGALNFEIQHRFGTVNQGAYNLFGLDFATLRLGLDYGISDRLSVGIGRSSDLKTFDGYLKYKLLRQTENFRMPVSVSLLGTTSYYTEHYTGKDSGLSNKYRFNYTAQIMIARKFNNKLSIELTPTFIHYNLVETAADQNNVFALGTGVRYKFTKRMAITAEYDYLFPNQLNSVLDPPRTNSLSFGWDIETGGHVFQLVFTNSQSMVGSQYIGQTQGTWGKGYIYFGFNISRNFNLKPHKA